MAEATPYILTLRLDQQTFTTLNALREAHFPAERNLVPAHVTLFHALPSQHERILRHDLDEECAAIGLVPLTFARVRFLGRGVALAVDAPELVLLHQRLARRWWSWLTPQDRQPYHPHVTIQNKAPPTVARALFEQLAQTWQPLRGVGEGLQLWRYLHGPWEHLTDVSFNAAGTPGSPPRAAA